MPHFLRSSMNKPDNKIIWKYAGLATQLLVGIGLALFLGKKLDEALEFVTPVAVWVLPLILIVAVIIRIIIDTAPKK